MIVTANSPAQRSGFVTGLAWVGMALSGIALAWSGTMLIFSAPMIPLALIALSAGLEETSKLGLIGAFMLTPLAIIFMILVTTIVAILALVSSVGLLKRKNWARIMMIWGLPIGIVLIFPVALGSFVGDDATLAVNMDPSKIEAAPRTFRLIPVATIVIFAWAFTKLVSKRVRAEFQSVPSTGGGQTFNEDLRREKNESNEHLQSNPEARSDPSAPMALDTIQTACAAYGLIVRGSFHPAPEDGVPGNPATVVLIGNAGPAMWRTFEASEKVGSNPLDAWTRKIVSEIATSLGATALFPFDGPPYWPFQRWAMKAESLFQSPIGPTIHPEYGLWHAYRGALAFDTKIDLPDPAPAADPCQTCADKPCLTACPVGALTIGNYDVPACVSHIDNADGADCLDLGCAARRACPIGRDHVYAPAQARFHMDHFRRANRPYR